MTEPIFDIAHVGHVELYTPVLEESLLFFTESMGMEIVKKTQDSAFLRCWGDYETYSIKLTQNEFPGVGHTALRTTSEAALERRVAAIEQSGRGIGWIDGDFAHGRAYQYYGVDGHLMEIYYQSDRYIPVDELKPPLKNQPQKYTGKGAAVKSLDHINYLAVDPEADGLFLRDTLGMQLTEQIQLDNNEKGGVWYRCMNKSYDVVYTLDHMKTKGRLHHIAFAVETFEEIVRASNLFVNQNVKIEFAPSRHTINQTYFVYVIEPGGNRIEICAGGYLIFDPEFEAVTWTEEDRKRGQYYGNETVSTFHTYGTPTVVGELVEHNKK